MFISLYYEFKNLLKVLLLKGIFFWNVYGNFNFFMSFWEILIIIRNVEEFSLKYLGWS